MYSLGVQANGSFEGEAEKTGKPLSGGSGLENGE